MDRNDPNYYKKSHETWYQGFLAECECIIQERGLEVIDTRLSGTNHTTLVNIRIKLPHPKKEIVLYRQFSVEDVTDPLENWRAIVKDEPSEKSASSLDQIISKHLKLDRIIQDI